MKRMMIIILLFIAINQANAELFRRDTKETKTGIAEFKIDKKFLTTEQQNNIIGTWTFRSNSGAEDFSIRIKRVFKSKGKNNISTFAYEVLNNNNFVVASDISGTTLGNYMFFTVPYIEGYSEVTVLVSRNGRSGRYVEQYISNSSCVDSGLIDNETGLTIYGCIFPTSFIGNLDSGSGSN